MTSRWIRNSLNEKYKFQFHLKEFHTIQKCNNYAQFENRIRIIFKIIFLLKNCNSIYPIFSKKKKEENKIIRRNLRNQGKTIHNWTRFETP